MFWSKKKIIAIIPARGGSERIINKNFRQFLGKPLILYAIVAAYMSRIFDDIAISSDKIDTIKKIIENIQDLDIKDDIMINTIFRERPNKISGSTNNDCEWITDFFDYYGWNKCNYYMILRPTNPFRTYETIRRAWKQYNDERPHPNITMKSVQAISERPEKMWYKKNERDKDILCPYITWADGRRYWEQQSSLFRPLFVQNGCIDICPIKIIRDDHTKYIGDSITPFFTHAIEGFDLNTPDDWKMAELIGKEIYAMRQYINSTTIH